MSGEFSMESTREGDGDREIAWQGYGQLVNIQGDGRGGDTTITIWRRSGR